jgi:alkanesulfonate monooxygenase SsuD/methylene tetrahydromethanopterin reductase-like flavin-dependent oxidoreductase (luciferase family)
VADYESRLTQQERMLLDHALSCSAIGSPQTVRHALESFIAATGADELMITSQIFDHAARLRSYEITADIHRGTR